MVKSVCLSVLVLSLQFVCGQYYSPCPDVFNFEDDGHHIYGKIILRPTGQVSSLIIRINFTVAAQVLGNYYGRIDAHDGDHLLQRYNRGQVVSYLVHFPVTSPLPKLTALTANGDLICYGPGDVSRPGQYISMLSLQHTSYLQGGGSVYNNFQHQPQTRPQQRPTPGAPDHLHFGDDDASAHIYTFNNIEPTFNTGSSPYYDVNSSPQYTQPAQQFQSPTAQVIYSRPIYEYDYPVQVTTRRPITYMPVTYRPVTNRPATYRPVSHRPDYYTPDYYRPDYYRPDLTNQYNNFYSYPDDTTPAPRPVVTASPDDQRFSSRPPSAEIECGVIAGGNERVPLIYNGRAYARGEIPWLVAIYKKEEANLQFICGGTLISERHIITAAHCMKRRGVTTYNRDIVVKIGVHNLNDWSDDITVTRSISASDIHQAYNAVSFENDILTLTLDKRVTFNDYIRPACLWSEDVQLQRIVGKTGVVAGWGDQGVGGIGKQGEPHMVRIPIVSTTDCRASKPEFHKLTFDTTICAGDRNGTGPCIGDSGGGLYMKKDGKWRLRGVVSVSLASSNDDNTCNLDEYIVFTDTAQYLTWIRSIVSQKYYD